MPTAGFVFNGAGVTGLVSEIDWGEWDVAVQTASAFGVVGTSVIDGGRRMRRFSFPMMVWGWTDPASRDNWMMSFEAYLGQVGSLVVNTTAATIVNLPYVRFSALKPGRSGQDGVHGYYRRITFAWEQLQPPAGM